MKVDEAADSGTEEEDPPLAAGKFYEMQVKL